MPFKFIHAADLHLDSPFRGVTAQAAVIATALQDATFSAFDRLIQLAMEQEVLFVLVAGDVYDAADRSIRAQLRFRDGLARLAAGGIRSFVVHGNHDPLDGWSSALTWPDGVEVFGVRAHTLRVEQDGHPVAAVSGISYGHGRVTESLAQRLQPEAGERFQIALLLANCGGYAVHEPYAPCTLDALAAAGFDYWALGHVHEHAVLRQYPHVVYPGTAQGRHIRESGPRGACVVRVDQGKRVELQFHALDSVRWIAPSVSISGVDSVDALQRALEEEALGGRDAAAGRPVVCRLILEGRGALYEELARDGALTELCASLRENLATEEPFVWVERLESRCRPEMDLARRQEQGDLLGTALKVAAELLDSDQLATQMAPALEDLFQHRRAGKALDELSATELRALVDEARWLCVELLEGGA